MSLTTRSQYSLAAIVLCAVLGSTQALALEGSWQAGINAGVSLLSPDTDGSGFTLDDDQSTAVSAYLGLDITPIISVEAAFTDLGEAALSDSQSIGYQALSIGATAYVWGEKEADSRSDGVSAYLRLGFSVVDNDSDINLNEANNTALWLGAGIQYPFSDRWGMRAELASYDGDAQALMAGLYWRKGERFERSSSVVGEGSITGLGSETPSANESTAPDTQNPASTKAPILGTEPIQPDVVAPVEQNRQSTGNDEQNCPPAAAAKISDPQACALLNSVLSGIEFVGKTAEIAPTSTASLDRIVTAIDSNPEVVLEIRAHTQSLSNPQLEAQLSAQRAKSVARYLVQNGVPVAKLRAKAFGATQPLSGEEQGMNSRIELRTL